MRTEAISRQESSGTDLEITVCANGVVNVHNPESDRAHSVMLNDSGAAVRCSCKGHRFNGHCYHTREVGSRPLIVTSALAASSAPSNQVSTDASIDPAIATDGGTAIESTPADEPKSCDECGTTGELVDVSDGE